MAQAFRIGTRQSPLALAQTRWVMERWQRPGIVLELVSMATHGDQVLDRALDLVGGKGLFTTELEQALQAGVVDCAVHSLKDLPTQLPEGISIGAVTAREDPRDVLITASGRTLAQFVPKMSLGTSSLRRAAMLRATFPDLIAVPVRGNLNTRLEKLDRGDVDGLVLAAAGVNRLGLKSKVTEYLDPAWMVPAPGQGALAIEVRADDTRAQALAALVHDEEAFRATDAERRILDSLGGNCQLPLGAHAFFGDGRWRLTVWVGQTHGAQHLRREWAGLDLNEGVDAMLKALEAAGARRWVGP